jgi:hypothetical protein
MRDHPAAGHPRASMNEAIGQVLSLGVGVALSPVPIIAVVLMLATPRARFNGPAFLLGWIAGLALAGAIVLLVSSGTDASTDEGPATWVAYLKLVLGLMLLALALKQWHGRPKAGEEAALPKWMQTIDTFGPPKALAIGILLRSSSISRSASARTGSSTGSRSGWPPTTRRS